ncbi:MULTISPECIES: hypothetical protein [unclassified Halanaerobium]|uniref:hypothetical protein n=1 Tax=unclassified Halanaerobium TaxID=2641197 RepID=UPI000DF1EA86|nr:MULTISPECIES: hypothetical protein [unclassified Halanaerobium]RCW48666.1 hypothetical protein DFR78_10849 [Halanaerobium sp. MA284_MarDTE_T2]RCW86590.1 hypothetical protein DER71_10853 [Halanaerobium sp. DL-01]
MKTKNYFTAYEYLNQLKLMYKSYFDLEENKEIANKKFDLYAFAQIKNEKYFASRKLKIWEYTQYDHCLIDINNRNKLIPDKNFLKNTIEKIVDPHRNHMQSYITFVNIRENSFTEKEINEINNFSYSKSFLLGFKGWCDVCLIAVDLSNNKVYTNQKGKKVADNYQPERFIKAKSS